MLTVLTPAGRMDRLGAAIETIQFRTGWAGATYDDIRLATSIIESWLGRTLARQQYLETFLPTRSSWTLNLSCWPVGEILSVVEDGRVLAETDFDIDAESGILSRLSGGRSATWMPVRTEVRYFAGYVMPRHIDNPSDRDLPLDIEDAVIRLAYARRPEAVSAIAVGTAGPVRRVQGGGIEVEFGSPSSAAAALSPSAIPADVLELLRPYRQPRLA